MSDPSTISLDDGYTLDGYIKADPGIHGEHRFKYRPVLHADRYVYTDEFARKTPREAARLMYAILAKHIKSWDVKLPNGDAAPLNVDTMRLVVPNLIERFYAIVVGRVASDANPNGMTDTEEADAELKALLEGTDIGIEREAAAGKN